MTIFKDITRSLQLTGARTYLLSLPREWIEKNGLEAKDEIGIRIENEKYLLLYPRTPRKHPQKATMLYETNEIDRELLARYVTGFEKIFIYPAKGSKRIKDTDLIRNEIRDRQIGLEIVRESPKQLEIQFIAASVLDLRTLIRKMYDLAFSMLIDSIDTIFSQNDSVKTRVINRYSEIDRVYFFIVRLLQQSLDDPLEELNLSPFECLNYQIVAYQGEMLGKSARELAERIGKFKKSFINPETESMVKEISEKFIELLSNALEAFLNQDLQLSFQIHNEVKEKKYQVQPIPAIISDEPYTDEHTWFLSELLSRLLEQADQLCYLVDLVARGVNAVQEYITRSFLDEEL